ncbi:unnamed protein product [Sphenostylis stenocarpa]|uniref:Uncharacterized protein n=1 Tax=Sphenostylis stenocarpa TaxID=92480 RepID=A0AA86SW94_9FABA|nr:unnamed protein product [Sphenostylis stenocarpa]
MDPSLATYESVNKITLDFILTCTPICVVVSILRYISSLKLVILPPYFWVPLIYKYTQGSLFIQAEPRPFQIYSISLTLFFLELGGGGEKLFVFQFQRFRKSGKEAAGIFSNSSMAKGIKNLSLWMEVAPPPIIFPTKPSNSPALETIMEEVAEEYSDKPSINSLLKKQLTQDFEAYEDNLVVKISSSQQLCTVN